MQSDSMKAKISASKSHKAAQRRPGLRIAGCISRCLSLPNARSNSCKTKRSAGAS